MVATSLIPRRLSAARGLEVVDLGTQTDSNWETNITVGLSSGRCPAGHEIPLIRRPFPADAAAANAYPLLMCS